MRSNITNIRRAGVLLLVAAMLVSWSSLRASDGMNVIFPGRVISVSEAFGAIERQTPYLISVNHTDFDISRMVHLSSTELSLRSALTQILNNTGREYIMREGHILIVREKKAPVKRQHDRRESPAAAQPRPVREPVAVIPEYGPVTNGSEHDLSTGLPLRPAKRVVSPEEAARRRREMAGSVVARTNYLKPPTRWGVKLNLLYGAGTLTPNLALEIGVGRRSTIDIAAGYNGWNMNGTEEKNRKLGHWIVQPEYRWWLCERFNGHFFGAHVFGGQFNISEHNIPLLFGEKNSADYRYYGWMVGAGISYGYQVILGRSWNLEFNAGIGYGRMFYDRYRHERCGELIGENIGRNYFGPTKAGITLTYLIK